MRNVGALLSLACGVLASAATFVGCSEGDRGGNAASTDASTSETASPPIDASLQDAALSDIDAFTPDAVPTEAALGDSDGLVADAALGDDSDGDLDAAPDANDCAPGDSGEPTELRCTGLYSDWASRTISADVHQYAPGFVLWSDGATKTRWIYLPPGQRIDTSNMDEWTFPVGTKVWKEFALGGKRIETRLLWKTADASWYSTTYRWSADEWITAELTEGQLNADGNGYEVPSQAACVQCHQGRQDYLLGFEAVALSSPNASGVTMAVLASQGLLSAPPSSPTTIPGTTTDVAALGYLHANCGTTCHNAGFGLARNTGFHMRLDVSTLSSVQATDTWTTGWNVPARFPGLAGAPMLLAQCSTTSSGVYYRMSHRDGLNDAGPGSQMPPIDTHKIDSLGVALIAAWINEGCTDAGPDTGSDAASDARSE